MNIQIFIHRGKPNFVIYVLFDPLISLIVPPYFILHVIFVINFLKIVIGKLFGAQLTFYHRLVSVTVNFAVGILGYIPGGC